MSGAVARRGEQVSVLGLLSVNRMFANLWQHRDLLWQFTLREVLVRNKGTSLGVVWSLLMPLITLSVYAFVFGVVFPSRWGGSSPGLFVLPMFCGATLFNVFAESVIRAPGLVVERPNYVKRVVFPIEILPASVLGSCLILATVNLALLLLVQALVVHRLPWTVVVFPVVLLPLAMLTLGLSWLLASLGVFVRDIRNAVAIVVSPVLFFLSPVFYPVEQIPEPFRVLVGLNPLTPILEDGRRTLLWGEPPHWLPFAAVSIFSLAVMQLGYAWFMKTKRGFADVV
jgi:lipopolysaccharide transport system permease protein